MWHRNVLPDAGISITQTFQQKLVQTCISLIWKHSWKIMPFIAARSSLVVKALG
jgi:hypothetical protein